jgi:hypothetical protein
MQTLTLGTPQFVSCVESTKMQLGRRNVMSDQLAPYLATCRNRAGRLPASIRRELAAVILCFVGSGQYAMANICPCAVVQWFLLKRVRWQQRSYSIPDTIRGQHWDTYQDEA